MCSYSFSFKYMIKSFVFKYIADQYELTIKSQKPPSHNTLVRFLSFMHHTSDQGSTLR